MKTSIKQRIEKIEQNQSVAAKVPPGFFVSPSMPDIAWPSRKDYELYKKEIAGTFVPVGNYDFDYDKIDLHFKNAGIIQQRCVRLRPERPTPACLLEMINFPHDAKEETK